MHIHSIDRRQMLALAIAAGLPSAFAQTSARPVSFIVPQPAGGASDGNARAVQPVLQKLLGQTVVVENLPGAGGSIGLARTLSPPAGTATLMIASQTEPILTPLALVGVRYKPEDFRCVGVLGRCPYVLIGRPDIPAKNHAELLALGRTPVARPLTYGHIGPGSMIHLLGAEWSRQAGVPVTHIPYKGVPPALQDLMGNQIDLTFAPVAGSLPSLLESGKVRVFGSTGAEPSTRMPTLPLLHKLDRSLSQFVYGTWGAVFVPATAPADFVERVQRAIASALQEPEVQTFLDGTGLERSSPMSTAELERFYHTEIALYTKMARDVGVERQ